MPYIKATHAAMREIRQERPYENGEAIVCVAIVWRWYNPNTKEFVDSKVNKDCKKSWSFLLDDGRKLQFSRFWGSRVTETGRLNASDDGSPVKDLCKLLPMNLDDKVVEYVKRSGASGYDFENQTLSAEIHLEEVTDGKAGFKHWYSLRKVRLTEVKPLDNLTDAQRTKLERWAAAAEITIDLNSADALWWAAALGY